MNRIAFSLILVLFSFHIKAQIKLEKQADISFTKDNITIFKVNIDNVSEKEIKGLACIFLDGTYKILSKNESKKGLLSFDFPYEKSKIERFLVYTFDGKIIKKEISLLESEKHLSSH